MAPLEDELRRVAGAVDKAGLMKCLVAGRNSVHLPLVLGADDTAERFKDTIRIVLGLSEKNKNLENKKQMKVMGK
jgi:hypothetical protein